MRPFFLSFICSPVLVVDNLWNEHCDGSRGQGSRVRVFRVGRVRSSASLLKLFLLFLFDSINLPVSGRNSILCYELFFSCINKLPSFLSWMTIRNNTWKMCLNYSCLYPFVLPLLLQVRNLFIDFFFCVNFPNGHWNRLCMCTEQSCCTILWTFTSKM